MTPLKKALLKHAAGVLLVACGVVLLVWTVAPDPDLPVRAVFAVATLLVLGAGAWLVMRGLRDAAVAITYTALLGDDRRGGFVGKLREELYMALDYRTRSLDGAGRRALFERYYQFNPHLDETFSDPEQARRREALLRATRGPRALEVGCATGGITQYLSQHGIGAVGTDISFEMVRHAADGSAYVQSDAYRLPFGNAVFDTVLLPEILEHLHEPLPALAEAARVARDRVVVTVPNETVLDPTHVHVYDVEGIRALAARVPGLEVADVDDVPPFLVVTLRRAAAEA